MNRRATKKRKEEYLEFLKCHDGVEIFCYTNRKNFYEIIEREIIPSLDSSIKIVKLIGKEPSTDLNEEMVSHMLFNIKNIGFPNAMKIVKGEVIDISMHKELYDGINNGNIQNITELVQSKFAEIRHRGKN